VIDIPAGLLAAEEHHPPDLGGLYWVSTVIFADGDFKPRRPVVVIAIHDETVEPGIITVVRSTTDKRGQEHPPQPDYGLSKRGWFSQLRPVNRYLWTPANVHPVNLILDDVTLAYVMRDHL
jgi:hypothetical protein